MFSCLHLVRFGAWLGTICALLIILRGTLAAQCGTAPTGDPGGFGIDGDLDPGSPTPNTTDWMSIIMPNGTPTSSTTLHGVDAFNNSDRAFFGDSRLFGNPNNQWSWDSDPMTNPLGGKENFSNGVAHFSSDVNGHIWFTWAVDRQGSGGQSYMDVGLYQNSLVRNGNGTFSSAGPHGGHTVGDLVLSLDLLDPMTSIPILTVWRWTEIAAGDYDFTSLAPADGTKFTCANHNFMTSVPYSAFGNNFYPPDTFAEASIDLSALLAEIQPSISFQTVFFESRFGDQIASVLKDFIDPISTQIPVGVGPSITTSATRILTISPNPARGPVSVQFELAEDGPVSLEIFDLAGRRVGSLARATFPAGRHVLRWDPKSVAPQARGGILYARLSSGAGSDGRRFVFMP